jgi:hypothetical protein
MHLACLAVATAHTGGSPTRVHGRSSFVLTLVIVCGACVDKKSSCTLDCGRNPEVPGAAVYHVLYDELLGPVLG